MVLSQEPTDGDLGVIGIGTAIFLGAGGLIASLLGGGWLWTKHEELELEEEFNRWRDIYQNPPYNMTPEEAIAAARGIMPSDGFDFGLNVPTVILVGGSLFALYVGSQVLVKWLSPGKK
jgi:hypothetical protein